MRTSSLQPGAIAIVGMGCRFPMADDADRFWQNILAGRDSFAEIPRDRWDHRVFFNKNQREVDKAWASRGSFLSDIKSFAALHYGIAPRRLEVMDPQQRLLIESTRVAIQDAGYEARRFSRERTGVFVGVSVSEFKNIAQSRLTAMQLSAGEFGAAAGAPELRDALLAMTEDVVPTRAFSLAGSLTALNAAAISQTFDLGGPSFAIDAACASACVAIHEAILHLRAGAIDAAIAGGCYLNLTPDNLVAFTRIGAISPSGVCRPFDAQADGFVQSDGVGVIFLKRLEDALRDGDRIHAVLRGTGCNNDGRGEGPMTPRVEGQLVALRSAYLDAGVSPETVALFEAHGTATTVGDPVEIQALGQLLAEAGVDRSDPALVGSVKGNIGHAMAAAGIAGVIKAVKVLQHRIAPPQANFSAPNPLLGLDRWPLAVSRRAQPLLGRRDEPLRVAVSSFGFGGTNSHLVLEAPPSTPRPTVVAVPAPVAAGGKDAGPRSKTPWPEAVLVTAPTTALLAPHLRELAGALEAAFGAEHPVSLADVAYTLNARRRHERVRAVIGARTPAELIENLRRAADALARTQGEAVRLPLAVSPDVAIHDSSPFAAEVRVEAEARPKVAFMFPGQGAQRLELLAGVRRRFAAFGRHLTVLEAATADLLPAPLSSYVYPDEARRAAEPREALEGALANTEVCQPAMAALGLALARLLGDFGVTADVSLGHSLGEFAALADAGVLDPAAAVRFVARRGRAMRDLQLPDPGAMAAVLGDPERVRVALVALPGADQVCVANVNHPRQVAISGTSPAVEAASAALRAGGFEVRALPVSHAFHSPLLRGIEREVEPLIAALELSPPRHPVVSCIRAEAYAGDARATRAVMLEHATSPVDFVRALQGARAQGATIFVHVGAGGMLANFARATLGAEVLTLGAAAAEDDGGYELIRCLATLAAAGISVAFEAVYAGEGRQVVSLPETPLERQQYWVVKGKQPRPTLDYPLPEAREGRSVVKLGRMEATMTTDGSNRPKSGASAGVLPGENLVQLFAQQAELLRAQTEIIAQQNRILLGEEAHDAPGQGSGLLDQSTARAEGPRSALRARGQFDDAHLPAAAYGHASLARDAGTRETPTNGGRPRANGAGGEHARSNSGAGGEHARSNNGAGGEHASSNNGGDGHASRSDHVRPGANESTRLPGEGGSRAGTGAGQALEPGGNGASHTREARANGTGQAHPARGNGASQALETRTNGASQAHPARASVPGGEAGNAASTARGPAPGGASAPGTSGSAAVRAHVFEIVARISAFPKESVRGEQRLVDELGFDSLMVADLGGALDAAYPGIGGIPPSLFSLSTTVNDITAHISSKVVASTGEGAPDRDGRPAGDMSRHARAEPAQAEPARAEPARAELVGRYRVVARARPRPVLASHDVRGETWLVTEDGSDLGVLVSAGLEQRGARVVRVRFTHDGVTAPARLALGTVNVWPECFAEGLLAALEADQKTPAGFIHLAGLPLSSGSDPVPAVQCLHAIAARLRVRRMATVTGLGGKLGLERSPALVQALPQAALLGYTKALARERPDALVRALDIDPTAPVQASARWLVEELLGADGTTEVGYDGADRYVAALVPAPLPREPQARRTIGPNDVVLITGGTGEIGAQIARAVAAHRPRALVLVSRRAPDDAGEAQLAELTRAGTKAFHVQADVTDAAALKAAVTGLGDEAGPVTVAIHAAGLTEDALASSKTAESLERVMRVKVDGAQALLRSFPALRDLILFSSWAGRFGNAAQTDYAAANALLDHLAVSGGGAARVLSLVWPPWSSTRMVRRIAPTFRRGLEAAGVTFLDDAAGVAAFEASFADAASGMEVIGRDLPEGTGSRVWEERFDLSRHPYLVDHQIQERPVVPLASAADLIAAAATGNAFPEAGRALVIQGLELVRGLVGDDQAVIRAETQIRGQVEEARVEIRAAQQGVEGHERSTAYRGRVVIQPAADVALAPLTLTGTDTPVSTDLDAFYEHHTFHGPRLAGIVKVERMTDAGIAGLVNTSTPRDWVPDSPRDRWAIDPLAMDASFQLAGYWAHHHLGRGGYPTGFERLTLVRPFGEGIVRATLVLKDVGSETFTCSVRWEDSSGEVIGVLENVRGRFFEVPQPAPRTRTGRTQPSAPARAEEPQASNGHGNGHAHAGSNGHAAASKAAAIPEENWNIALFPEVEAVDQRLQMVELVGLKNPYFHVHGGTARNRSVIDGVEMINFSSYNYLGFSGHPEVVEAAKAAIERYGTSVSASRIASGERPIHRQLEEGIAAHIGVEDAIVFVSGHATNVTTVGHMFARDDLIVHDSLIHDSILQGIHLSGATRRPFPHGDLDAMDRFLAQARGNYRRVLICAEGIYSMDGDTSNLPRLIEIKKRHKALLLIDEAHSIGVLGPAGRGLGHHFPGVDPKDVDLWMGTLSKSFASCGGYIAGSKALVRYLKYTAPGFVYSAGITPPNCAAALKSLELMHRHPEVVELLRQRSTLFLNLARARGIDTGLAVGAAVVPAIIGNSMDCVRLSEALAGRRINVQPIVYPAVEDDASRLRFFLSATHTEEELQHTVEVLVEELQKIRGGAQPGSSLSI